MFSLNLSQLSNYEVQSLVWQRCAMQGAVRGVSVHRRTSRTGGAFAMVEMSSAAEVHKVLADVGDLGFRRSALIKLTEESFPAGDTDHAYAPGAEPKGSSGQADARLGERGVPRAAHERQASVQVCASTRPWSSP
jgi:hypothetical protein